MQFMFHMWSAGINRDLLERLQLPVPDQERSSYSLVLVERLIRVMSQAAQPGDMHHTQDTSRFQVIVRCMFLSSTDSHSAPPCFIDGKVRLATLELSCLLLKQSVLSGNHCIIKDVHLACLEVEFPHTDTLSLHKQQFKIIKGPY